VAEASEENRTIVNALLAAAGLRPPAEEVERLAELYEPMRRQLASLYAADVGDVDPASVFRAGEIATNGRYQP